jgi:putative ABC transport system ATP-binding protein
MVFQFFNLLPHLTVRDNVELPRRLDGARDAERRAPPSSSSASGSRAARPRIPTSSPAERCSGRDRARPRDRGAPAPRRRGRPATSTAATATASSSLLDEVRRERGVTLVLATHSAAAAKRADRTVEICDGRIRGGC